MKAAVFVLALANLLFFAYAQGYFGRPDNPDAVRMLKQIHPEGIRVVGRGEPPAEKTEAKPDGEARSEGAATAQPETRAAAEACLLWTGLAGKDADRVATLLNEKFDDFKVARKTVAPTPDSWWVHIPPYANKADAEKKAGELKKLGISDFFVVQDAGPNRWAISLGIFSAENGAKERLSALKDKGVKSAKITPRSNKETTHTLEARGPEPRQKPLQEALAAVSGELAGKACP